MKKVILFTALAFFVMGTDFVYSQATKYCGTTEADKELMELHPEMILERQALEEYTQNYVAAQANQKSAAVIYKIPVVFHVIHNYGPENISDAQIKDAVAILTRDFNRLNPDTAGIVPEFKNLIADCDFEFYLARKDPNGNCTNGIDRIASTSTYNGTSGGTAKLNIWNRAKYLNVWVVNKIQGGAAGNALYPSNGNTTIDGIMIIHNYVGSIGTASPSSSRALTHEVGHYLNLQHVWGSTNVPGVSCGGDGVNDTPPTKGYDYCPTSSAAAKICDPSIVENAQNYMEYSYCPAHNFTPDQKTRMIAALNSSTGSRNNLWSSGNLTATGISGPPVLCKADFLASKEVVCEGGTVTYTDNSWNGTPTSWNWSFPGGTPSTGTTSSVNVVYQTAGTYTVSLTVSDGTSAPLTATTTITVMPNVAVKTLPFFEGFEGVTLPNVNWTVNNPDNKLTTWQSTTATKYTGTSSVKMNNYNADTGRIDELISTSFDFTSMSNPKIYFKVAYAQVNANSKDQLRVLISTDCGNNWANRQTKSGATLASVPSPISSAFTPSSTTQWRLDSITNLAPYYNNKNIRVKFEFTNAGGNNLYIDDISIIGTPIAGINNLLADNIDFNIYPNPTKDKSVVSFNLIEGGAKITVSVYNILGKEVARLLDNEYNSGGVHQLQLNTTEMSSGIYFIKLTANENLFVQKLIVE